MRLVLRHVEKTKAGGWQYRRRVPKDLSTVILKREFKGKLGDTEREALAAYPAFHAKVEREIADARRSTEVKASAERGELSELQLYKVGYERAVEMGMLNTDWDGRDHLAQAMISRYPRDDETGYPLNPSKLDAFTIGILNSAGKRKPPQATLRDAMTFYLAERDHTEAPEEKERFKQQVERVVGLVVEALGKDPVLVKLTREDARSVRDFMLQRLKANGKPISPSSVARDLDSLNAVINHAAQEMPLRGTFKNPFSGLKIQGVTPATSWRCERPALLDLASGTGENAMLCHELGYRVTGLDWAEPMLDLARAKAAAAGAAITFLQADAEQTMLPVASQDVIVTRHPAWTLIDPAAAFAEWFRILAPGGTLLIVDGDFVSKSLIQNLLARVLGLTRRPVDGAIPDRHAGILSRVHFSNGARAEEVAGLLDRAGFAGMAIDTCLGAIHRAQAAGLGWKRALLRLSEHRYAISARKR